MSDRLQLAARDANLEMLKDATRKECNLPDEDGVTPVSWAAFHGHLDALRLLVGRGGDPDKCDHFGNTALHWAAGNGHMNCVSFLVNFGANLWALDNDYHTAKDRAGAAERDDILRYLDGNMGEQADAKKKQVEALKEKAFVRAEKRIKEYQRLQKKATKRAEEEEKRLLKDRQRMEKASNGVNNKMTNTFNSLRRDSKLLYGLPARFSEIVSVGTASKKTLSGVHKKIAKKRSDDGDFKVGETVSDGKRSTRSLSGLRRDSEIMYVPKYESNGNEGEKPRLQDVFHKRELSRSASEPGFSAEEEDNDSMITEPSSIFERPGFGSMAFRQTMSGALMSISTKYGGAGDDPNADSDSGKVHSDPGDASRQSPHDSIGSAGSLLGRRNVPASPWETDELLKEEEDDEDLKANSPIFVFLSAHGLAEFFSKFVDEDVDLDALMLLTEDDLVGSFHMALGPRRKLLKAVGDRKAALDNPGNVTDSQL